MPTIYFNNIIFGLLNNNYYNNIKLRKHNLMQSEEENSSDQSDQLSIDFDFLEHNVVPNFGSSDEL